MKIVNPIKYANIFYSPKFIYSKKTGGFLCTLYLQKDLRRFILQISLTIVHQLVSETQCLSTPTGIQLIFIYFIILVNEHWGFNFEKVMCLFFLAVYLYRAGDGQSTKKSFNFSYIQVC